MKTRRSFWPAPLRSTTAIPAPWFSQLNQSGHVDPGRPAAGDVPVAVERPADPVEAPVLLRRVVDHEDEQFLAPVAVQVGERHGAVLVLPGEPVRDRDPRAPALGHVAVGVEPLADAVVALVLLGGRVDHEDDQVQPPGSGEIAHRRSRRPGSRRRTSPARRSTGSSRRRASLRRRAAGRRGTGHGSGRRRRRSSPPGGRGRRRRPGRPPPGCRPGSRRRTSPGWVRNREAWGLSAREGMVDALPVKRGRINPLSVFRWGSATRGNRSGFLQAFPWRVPAQVPTAACAPR